MGGFEKVDGKRLDRRGRPARRDFGIAIYSSGVRLVIPAHLASGDSVDYYWDNVEKKMGVVIGTAGAVKVRVRGKHAQQKFALFPLVCHFKPRMHGMHDVPSVYERIAANVEGYVLDLSKLVEGD